LNPLGGKTAIMMHPLAFRLARIVLMLAAATIAGLAPRLRADAPDVVTPNIILIFTDDLGYGDLACYGSTKHRTPHIDRMAAEGLKLTSFYTIGSVCTPSRAALMTGSYAHRVNMHVNSAGDFSVLLVGEAKGLHPDEITIAEVLKDRGYATACIGKWHLGDQPEFLPTRQGFDLWFGIPFSNDMGRQIRPMYRGDPRFEYPPLPLMRDEQVIETEPDQSQLTRRYTDEAIAFIRDHKDRPFFLYLAHAMPHWPHYASEPFRGRSANGIYGDCIEELDASTGRILHTLAELNLDRRTLVIFTSDNGALPADGGSNAPLGGAKGWVHEGGMRVPCIVRWPGGMAAGRVSDEIVTAMDFLPTFAELAGGRVPADRVIDGRSVAALLRGDAEARSPHEAFHYYLRDQLMAVRAGPWKLVVARRYGALLEAPHLFNLETDPVEQQNVASAHPDVVRDLTARIEAARRTLGDRDRPIPAARPAGWVDAPRTLTQRAGPLTGGGP
jgi:arylsulfatase A